MSSTDLIIATLDDAPHISGESWSPTDQPTLSIDPVDNVSLTQLLRLVTSQDYQAIMGKFNDLTPAQPNVEPWDMDDLLAQVLAVPDEYVRTIANLQDSQLSSLAEDWSATEELARYKFQPADMVDLLSALRAFAAQCLDARRSLLMRLAT